MYQRKKHFNYRLGNSTETLFSIRSFFGYFIFQKENYILMSFQKLKLLCYIKVFFINSLELRFENMWPVKRISY